MKGENKRFEDSDSDIADLDSRMKKTEEDGVKNILRYFDRIHDKLFTFNNILIAGHFAMSKVVDSISPYNILVPITNLIFLIFIEYRMMERSRNESRVRTMALSQIKKLGESLNKTNLYSLLAIFSTTLVTIHFLFKLFNTLN